MKKLFLTTAIVFPLAFAPALAQTPVVPAGQDPASDAAQAAGDAADAANEAAQDAAKAANDAAQDAADAATEAAQDTTDAATEAAQDAQAAASDAADAAADATAAEDVIVTDPDKLVRQQATNELRLDWVTGATVMSPDGETVGSISDLILDNDNGKMAAAVIGVGGFLGIGEKKIAVPWDRLVINYDANQITSDLSRAEADAAPEYVFRDREPLPPVDVVPAVDPAAAPAVAPAPGQ